MGSLYETYQNMTKQAQEAQTVSEVEQARIQVILEKTAQAEELIKEAGITECSCEDVADVVTALIAKDIEEEEAEEKVASLYEMGRVMARGIDDELQAITNERKQAK